MLASFTLDVLAILAGAFGMLWLLLARFGAGAAPIVPSEDALAIEGQGVRFANEDDEPFIAMPNHLKTRSEMVDWMTQELPKLTDKTGVKGQRY